LQEIAYQNCEVGNIKSIRLAILESSHIMMKQKRLSDQSCLTWPEIDDFYSSVPDLVAQMATVKTIRFPVRRTITEPLLFGFSRQARVWRETKAVIENSSH